MTSATPKPRAGEYCLVVTRDGLPVTDQTQGIRDFKAACLRAADAKPGSALHEILTDRDRVSESLKNIAAQADAWRLERNLLRERERELVEIVARVDELSEAFDLREDKGRRALANEMHELGLKARTALANHGR